ncbi:MAG TPA: PadR family transcriptional regulator [Intrasporangium sp.]|uniref:PadR family transcriptional regulator n=1 Tax=Intrasporangium sp. TaxID=1925024 RepID=UPI002D78EEDE|nr:PadR family transcriptional regulator [Intrasporangium sp.]HET7397399.1 PadR family transcriptional regulator [Intrasporangium sp.]
MSNIRLTTTSYVVLGMIAMRGPSTSYELKRAVGHSVGYFWPFPHAQLYSEPKRLVELGLLDVQTEEDGRRRQTYSVTPAGMAALRQWLTEPTEEPLQVRDVGELKLFFGEFAEPESVLSLAREQVEQHEERIATYEQIQARFGRREEVAHRMVPLRLGLAMEYAALQFWQDLLKERS